MTVTDLVAANAAARPDAVAIIAGDQRMRYGTLDRSANRVAHRLAAHGLGPEDVVAVAGDRTPHAIAAVLGVLKAGCAYLPFDPAEPPARLRAMLAAARVGAVIGAEPIDDLVPIPVHGESAEPPPVPRHDTQLAYVIFTSGSTGTPKGVCVEHRALNAFVAWYRRSYTLDSSAVVGQFYRLAFDASLGEIFPTLCSGALLVMLTAAEVRSPPAIEALVRRHRVTHLDLPAPVWEAMRPRHCPSLRFCTTGGDPVAATTVRHCGGAGRVLRNAYGPTEATNITTLADCDPRSDQVPPIGRPVPGTTAHVLDEQLTPVTPGQVGELCLGGSQVARGYAGDPAATAVAFVPDPWSTLGRLYRTGDLVRQDRDGTLRFVGRADRQVKVAGHRVELAEIEHALSRCAGVGAAVVTATADGGRRRLVGHLVGDVEVVVVRRELRAMLPAHMVPGRLMVHEALPYTPNGKVDHDALHELAARPSTAGMDGPLAEVIADVLGHAVRPDDSFIGAGGDSLDALRVIARLRAGGLAVDHMALLSGTPLSQLACDPVVAPPATTDEDHDGPIPMTPTQAGMWFVQLVRPKAPLYNLPFALDLYGPVDVPAMRRAWRRVRARHEAMRYRVTMSAGSPGFDVCPLGASGDLDYDDLASLAPDRRDEALASRLARQLCEPIDLRTGVPVLAELVRLAPERHVLLVTAHHLVCDGWSIGVLVRELSATYLAATGHATGADTPVTGFADHARRIAERAATDGWADGVGYWRDLLRGMDGRLFAGAGHPTGQVRSRVFDLPAPLAIRLRRLAVEHDVTPFVPLLTGCARGLAALSGRDEFVVGVVCANRPDVAAERVVGMFANTVLLPVLAPPAEPYQLSLKRMASRITDSWPYWDVPLPMVVSAAGPDRGMSGQPLFDTGFSFDTTPTHAFHAGEVTGALRDEGPGQGAVAELTVRISPCGESYHCALAADAGVFDDRSLAGVELALRQAWDAVPTARAQPGGAR